MEQIDDSWIIPEVTFYWDKHCSTEIPGLPSAIGPLDYQNLPDTSRNAFDKRLTTKWRAACDYAVGGCAPQSTRLYLDINDEDNNIEIIDPLKTNVTQDASIRCIKMHQSEKATELTRTIGIVFWTGTGFALYRSFSTLGGGGWQTRPPHKDTLWRITNLQYTPAPWEINELHFFGDRVCSHKLEGVVISTDHVRNLGQCFSTSMATYTCDENAAMRVTDGQVETFWKAKCGVGRATCSGINCGCEVGEAYIGMDFNTIGQQVKCLQIYQAAHEGFYTGYGSRHHAM
jgi:hypothetical protein